MRQKESQKYIYKLHSKQLRNSKWKLTLPLELAIREYPDCIVTLSSSQALRFIDELNGVTDIDRKIKEVRRKIKAEKKKPKSRESKTLIRELYNTLYNLQFESDYICVIMDSNKDYDNCNKGFIVNGKKYKRFLGTNGGIKNSTIVYINEELYPELKRRLENGRNPNKEMVPAKFEAYQALICSGSTPIPEPEGIIVVKDCFTKFKDDIILLDDNVAGEPKMEFRVGYEIEHDCSDGFGLMLPKYSQRVNEYLSGKSEPLSGMNTRYAWTKGMLYTFDFIEFAESIAGTFEITDVWGDKRDVRNAEVILTESMLKLWDSYSCWEDYYENCKRNGYQFSTPKITPESLENVRNTNYQFLQSYEFTDEELQKLCQPTIDEIRDVLGMDYRKSLVYLAGKSLDESKLDSIEDMYIKALMVEPELINDTFIRRRIYSMIKKRIELAKKGSIMVNANFAMISGDPYALCQNMFGLKVTGLLKAGELYHKYWIDKGATELACFRAPMTCHNNIRRLKLNDSEECQHWYQYIKTASILNAWDTTCEAMNGSDFDGDTNMCTDNPIIVSRTLNSPTILCVQRKAEKKIPTEEDIIKANKLAFNDDIGTVTNHVTSMIEVQSGFEKGTKEYDTLSYRIMCGQLYQQNTIDRIKGIIADPMPEYWYSPMTNKKHNELLSEEEQKMNNAIIAPHKPYFMVYIYNNLKQRYKQWERGCNHDVRKKFRLKNIEELSALTNKTKEQKDYLRYYQRGIEVGLNSCVVNRICKIFENEFPSYSGICKLVGDFDYSILKSNVEYAVGDYEAINSLYRRYKMELDAFRQNARVYGHDGDDERYERDTFVEKFQMECRKICPNEQELCDIILDLCYQKEYSKQFAWDIIGDVIVDNLLRKNDYMIQFPKIGGTEFEFSGDGYDMVRVRLSGEEE